MFFCQMEKLFIRPRQQVSEVVGTNINTDFYMGSSFSCITIKKHNHIKYFCTHLITEK